MSNAYIGDKAFYRRILLVAVPIIIQNAITNFVSLLDNIMIGQVGTVEMSGVAISNQLLFVFNLFIFGAVSGAGIFGAQFYGNGDHEGVRHTFRFKLIACTGIALVGIAVFLLGGRFLIEQYLLGEGSLEDAAASLHFGQQYIHVMLLGILPFSWANTYASTLRETGETMLPMKAGIVAVLVNLVFNYILIFGHFGAPKLGVVGAAIATVLSRFVELGIMVVWSHRNVERFPFFIGAYRSLSIPWDLAKRIIIKGTPLLINEGLWASGIATLNQCYSIRSLDVIAAININTTIWNVFSCIYLSMGNAIGILVGQELGASRFEGAKDTARKMTVFSMGISLAVGALMYGISGAFPMLYNTTDAVRELAASFIRICAILTPSFALTNALYFTLRAGGKTIVTFLFDSCFVWALNLPVVYILSRYTAMPILPLFWIGQGMEIIKCIIGYVMVKKGVWIQNIVAQKE